VNPNLPINLFPDPAWVEGVDKKCEIKVYDLMGKLIMHQEVVNTLT